MRQLVINGNLIAPHLVIIEKGSIEAFSDLKNVSNDAVVINGDVRLDMPQTVNFELYVTGEITEREV